MEINCRDKKTIDRRRRDETRREKFANKKPITKTTTPTITTTVHDDCTDGCRFSTKKRNCRRQAHVT
ncbi:hypothetical protein T01_511 [Trichinella spiralis]|uniref:Uncharacterized protein n=1 Tax=Trichinella spiralis TaxID=6334 RepID=A0A0V1BNI9_TRISP|nr:hypothetical protein T01_511 [Trichinella spiralis]